MSELLDCGIYVIINKKLKIVYVGQTQKNFLIRWIEHLRRIEKYADDPNRLRLYLDSHTQYLAVKKLEKQDGTLQFFEFENQAMDFYESRGWTVVSERHERKTESEIMAGNDTRRYKETVKHMIQFLGSVDVKENYIGRLYNQVYKKIDKDFSTNVKERSAKGKVIDNLTAEELESAISELYPRYQAKRLAVLRKKYGF